MPITKKASTKTDKKVPIKQAIKPDLDDNDVIDTSVISTATPIKPVPNKKATPVSAPVPNKKATPSSAPVPKKKATQTPTAYNNFIRIELIRLTKDKTLSNDDRRKLFKETASRWKTLTEEQKSMFSNASLASGGSK